MEIAFDESSPQKEILRAALKEFVEYGQKGARMQSIADRANVNKALLHYYFSNKQNLHREVLHRVFRMAINSIYQSIDEADSPENQIRGIIRAYFSLFRQNPAIPRLMLLELNANSSDFIEAFTQVFQADTVPFPQKMIQIIEDGIERGIFRPVNPRQALLSTLGTVAFYFIARPFARQVLSIENEDQFIEERLEHIQDLIFHGLIKE
ncbi:MAG: HTH-type transcriptional regulator RutR [Candidatus Marinimicrobia bacterium]|nr:HTH-type transcriptional regulator RutR [Candidatus Neomarinimicrobiota bacterium]